MTLKEKNKRARERNRRPINDDGSVPGCLECGTEARKHIGRQRWYATCSKACGDKFRINLTIQTKSLPQFKETAKMASIKAHKTLREKIMSDGRTKAEHTTEKIIATNTKLGIDGLSNYERASRLNAVNVRTGNESAGHWTPIEQKTDFDQYRTRVKRCQWTFKNSIEKLDNFNRRGPSGSVDGFHIDHRISVWFGFKNNIAPEIIGHICNLHMKHWLDNNRKWKNSDLTLEELKSRITEYEAVHEII